MIESLIEKYKFLEKSDHPTKMADYLLMWKDLRKSEVAETTYVVQTALARIICSKFLKLSFFLFLWKSIWRLWAFVNLNEESKLTASIGMMTFIFIPAAIGTI